MEAVGQLTGVAHDFNNFLGSILAALESAIQRQDEQRYPKPRGWRGQDAATGRGGGTAVWHLPANRYLTPQAVDASVAGWHARTAHQLLHAGIHFNDQTQPGAWPVRVDLSQLESSLLNLCINARDAMPSGGTLCIVPTRH